MYVINPFNWSLMEATIDSFNQLVQWLLFFEKEGALHKIHFGLILENKTNESLCVGMVQEEWVLIHSKDTDNQHFTISEEVKEGSVEIYFERLDELPKKMLILKKQALDAIQYWIGNGGMDNRIIWSN